MMTKTKKTTSDFLQHQRGMTMKRLLATAALAILTLASTLAFSTAEAAPTATITFAAPTKYTDGSNIATGTTITYRLYQGLKGGTKSSMGLITSGQVVTTGLQAGNEYCWEVTSIINGQESARSNEACKSFPFPVPEAVTITVQ